MSMTVVMNEAGMLELPPSVRKLLNLVGQTQFELDVDQNCVRLRPTENVSPPTLIMKGERLIMSGGPPLSDEDIVQAIMADRDELAAHHSLSGQK